MAEEILRTLRRGHPAGPAPDTLSELAAAVATQRQRLAEALTFVNSLTDLVDDMYGTQVGDDLRDVFDETGLLRFLRPVPLSGPRVDPAFLPSL